MAVPQVDILLKSAIEAGISDLRKNPWILDDVFGGMEPDGLANDALSQAEYGMKEVAAAKRWFLNNNIRVILQFRTDAPEFPAVTIVRGPSQEKIDRTSLGDDGSIEEYYDQDAIDAVQKVYTNFTPKSYDQVTGKVTFPDKTITDIMVPGQFLVSIKSGKAYQINSVDDASSFFISEGINDDFTDAYIAPPVALWNLHREQTFFQETFYIGCYGQSDPVQCIWLHSLVSYILLRYKEAYLEGRGFDLSTFNSAPMMQDETFKPEQIFQRIITLTGTTETSWVKFIAPKFQAASGGIVIMDGPKTPPDYAEDVIKQGWRMEADVDLGDEDEE